MGERNFSVTHATDKLGNKLSLYVDRLVLTQTPVMNITFAMLVIICTYFCLCMLMILLYLLKLPVKCFKGLLHKI